LKIKFVDFRVNVNILASTSVPFGSKLTDKSVVVLTANISICYETEIQKTPEIYSPMLLYIKM
jgi:hypothetical protein